MILGYFGDESEVEGCGCDNCGREGMGDFQAGKTKGHISQLTEDNGWAELADERSDRPRRSIHTIQENTRADVEASLLLVKKLLSGIARVGMAGQFGAGTIAEVLAGSDTQAIRRWGFEKLSVYGLLGQLKVQRVVAMLHRLIEEGLARRVEAGGDYSRPVVELTAMGICVMKGTRDLPAGLEELSRDDRMGEGKKRGERVLAVLDGAARERFERLRVFRREQADLQEIPAYCVFHDATLRLIALANPRTLEELAEVKGVGENKLQKYGAGLLEKLGQ